MRKNESGTDGSRVLLVIALVASNFPVALGADQASLELSNIRRELARARSNFNEARRSSQDDSQLETLRSQLNATELGIRKRLLLLAERRSGTKSELLALYQVAGEWPDSERGATALARLTNALARANLDDIGQAFESYHARYKSNMRPLVPVLMRIESENREHPFAGKILAEASLFVAPSADQADASPQFKRIADRIVEHHATSTKIANFCELFGGSDGSPRWAQTYEQHLSRILKVNEDRFVRCTAKLAHASIVQSSGALRQVEAAKLYEQFLAEFDGMTQYHADSIEKMYRESAERELRIIRSHGLGVVAPSTVGIDLEGNPMELSEFRGKVVLVSFWSSWCFPCMKMVPRENELLDRFPFDMFELVGVNGDTEVETALSAVTKHHVEWRSFQAEAEGFVNIVNQWNISGWPTLYLIDGQGVIRRRWNGEPPISDLVNCIEQLIESPQKEIEFAKELDSGERKAYPTFEVTKDNPGNTGFIAKTLQSDPADSKYVVFIPQDYSASNPTPLILFLHGAGAVGTDGRKQLGALANAVRQHMSKFPFIVVFPQAHEGDWDSESEDGKRAIAILDEVCSEYSVDLSRVCLTGQSMGGEGTWSLAAAHPKRWSAIVPICGVGDPNIANRIKHIPCWCFHGEADKTIHPINSRAMIEALRKAGGKPTYHEYPGVGHNCWELTYALPDLYEWLLTHNRL